MGSRKVFNFFEISEEGRLHLVSTKKFPTCEYFTPQNEHPHRRHFFAKVSEVFRCYMQTNTGELKINEITWCIENNSKYYILLHCDDDQYYVGMYNGGSFSESYGCDTVRCFVTYKLKCANAF